MSLMRKFYIAALASLPLVACSRAEDASPQSTPATGACDLTKPFEPLVRVGNLPVPSDSPSLSPDEKTIYFLTYREEGRGPFTLVTSTRTSTTDPLLGHVDLTVDWKSPAFMPSVSASGLSLVYFESGARVSHRADTASHFQPGGRAIPSSTPGEQQRDPFLLPDGSALYYVSGKIRRARRTGDFFADPIPVSGIGDFVDLGSPVVSDDERTIYWVGTPSQEVPARGKRTFVATRQSTDDPFGAAHDVRELVRPGGGAAGIMPRWLSPDKCRLYCTVQISNDELSAAQRALNAPPIAIYVAAKPR